jgi:hypothetical protein
MISLDKTRNMSFNLLTIVYAPRNGMYNLLDVYGNTLVEIGWDIFTFSLIFWVRYIKLFASFSVSISFFLLSPRGMKK